ncbi:MAG TPA: MFS transporter [Acetobacteraceae bacterium]
MTSLRCMGGLASLNFSVGAILTAFGPFFTVYLTQQGWSQTDIGFALSVGTASALIFQVPAGALIDAMHFKRIAIALALLLIGISAMMVVAAPTQGSVLTSRVLQAFAGCLLTPAIAALTLKLCGHDGFSEGLGSNGRYASLGSAFAAVVLGGVSYYRSSGTVFTFTALLIIPALATLLMFRDTDVVADDHPATRHPRVRKKSRHRPWHIFHDHTLHIFAVCVVLFHFSNAAMLPLALNELSRRVGQSGFVVSAAILVPQIVVMACSPWAGRLAQSIGRRPILLAGFAAVPLRALLFIAAPDAVPLVMIEVLDGVSATVFGLTMPLIAADLTTRTGYLNLAIGSLGLAAGLGATASTTVAGWLADNFGAPVAFFGLALAGLAAVALVWRMMPETRPGKPLTGRPAVVAA